ncbi:MAG: Ig-like domain-containing protein, partial [Anaerolineae bacterium]
MRRRRGCSLLVLGILFAFVACLVFAALAAVLVTRGEIPLYAPRVTGLQPLLGAAYLPTTPIIITFDQPMDMASVEAAFSVEPPIQGTFSWSEDSTQLTFLPDGSGYEPGSHYSVHLDAGALAATLPRRTARALQWGFALPTLVDTVRPEPGATDLGAWSLLEVDLNYTVECTPTLRTFSIKPEAVGLLGCRASNLVFTPTVSLDPGVEYVAGLAHVFLKGDATPRPGVQWEFSTAPPLSVVDWEPVSTRFLVDLTSPVRIQFSRPVDPASVLSRFSLQTAEGQQVAGQSAWESGGSTFVFQPAESLRPGISYKFDLGQGVRDELGFELEEPFSATFDTLQMLGPPTPLPGTRGVPLDSMIRVPFTRHMDESSVEAGLTVRPSLEGQITWEENTLVLAPTGGLAAETLYKFELGADVRDATGASLSRPSRWAFETEPFLREAEIPSGVEITQLGRPISLTFALPMDRASVEAALTISPTTPGSLRWSEDGRGLSFQPEPGWKAGSDYYVALSGTA